MSLEFPITRYSLSLLTPSIWSLFTHSWDWVGECQSVSMHTAPLGSSCSEITLSLARVLKDPIITVCQAERAGGTESLVYGEVMYLKNGTYVLLPFHLTMIMLLLLFRNLVNKLMIIRSYGLEHWLSLWQHLC